VRPCGQCQAQRHSNPYFGTLEAARYPL